MVQKRLSDEHDEVSDAVDATHLVGSGTTEAERHFLDLYLGHLERCKKHPSVPNFRLCVEAHDNLMTEIGKR